MPAAPYHFMVSELWPSLYRLYPFMYYRPLSTTVYDPSLDQSVSSEDMAVAREYQQHVTSLDAGVSHDVDSGWRSETGFMDRGWIT